jgi:putative transposase
MPYRKQQLVTGGIYHIINRRISNELFFKNTGDYFRGIFSIYEFNNSNVVRIWNRRRARARFKPRISSEHDPTLLRIEANKRDKLVEILTFCFMPNHIHLLLKQIQDRGISRFMQKLGAGYSGYFIKKYNHSEKGYFFKNRFVSVPVKNDEQLRMVFVYIHTNPIAIIEPKWKEIGIKNAQRAIKFLENEYRWSGYWDYIGRSNFPSLTERGFMSEVMGGEQGCKDFVNNWIKYKGEIKEFAKLALE